MSKNSDILLVAINAKYIHSSLGIRYIYANLEELKSRAKIVEFAINDNIYDIAEKILKENPKIVAIGVYIWNISEVSNLVEAIKKIKNETIVVLGGPEVSYEPFRATFSSADYIIQGEGEVLFYHLCLDIFASKKSSRIQKAPLPQLKNLKMPYEFYDDEDIKNRCIYIESSRGCPFLCEFCLSSIEEKVRYFDLEVIKEEIEKLWKRGVRHFKFVDRTFNLNIKYAEEILELFLKKTPPYLLHFEMIPDLFPKRLKSLISSFPPASIQLEVGIQSLDELVSENISRKIDRAKMVENLNFLQEYKIHVHLDLIVGLPGQSVESFGRDLDFLVSLGYFEIQIGVLKKLSGVAISRHDSTCEMIYSNSAPFEVLQTSLMDFKSLQNLKRFSRFWDIFYNSGNFKNSIRELFVDFEVFESFFLFSQWIFLKTESTWKISLDRQALLLFLYLVEERGKNEKEIAEKIAIDIKRVEGRKLPKFLRDKIDSDINFSSKKIEHKASKRQSRHL